MKKSVFFQLVLALLLSGCASLAPQKSTNNAKEQLAFVGEQYQAVVPESTQQKAARDVVKRLLGEKTARKFVVEIVPKEGEKDFFEVEAKDGRIFLRGTNGVSACRGMKWYLNEMCHCSLSWRGDQLNLPQPLPMDFPRHREETPFQYRYIFNNCIYGYSMAWWQWPEWERMLDLLALNGVNMPALLLGQEKVWQETYKELGYSKEDLNDFFAGPAWYPWQWMGNLDGWGGPLPQSVIDGQCRLQKKILNRARSLGMKSVLPGFSGHIPKAVAEKNPDLKYSTMEWWGFGPTYILDWDDPQFKKISRVFMRRQRQLYGTDHYYNIDPFNEMTPPRSDKEYIENMAQTIFSCIDDSDPEGVWVLMTWFCKHPHPDAFWSANRTKEFFDAVPDDRMLALELWGENWNGTAWYKQDGWYNKPWVWCILQNFGNRVDIYGSLENIAGNYQKVEDSPQRGNIQGMGIMTEGLGYNPIVYELVLDMMWGEGAPDLEQWKKDYLHKRYGSVPRPVEEAWEILYETRYQQVNLVNISPLCFTPRLVKTFEMDMSLIEAWRLMLEAAPQLKDSPAYQFDLVNIGREAMGSFAPYYTMKIQEALEERDLVKLEKASGQMLQYIEDFDRLMGANEHFLLGKWLAGARAWGADAEEKALLEWGAKRQITDWGGKIGSYAIKEWSGYFTDRMLPVWEYYLEQMEEGVRTGREFDQAAVTQTCEEMLNAWPHRHSYLPTTPRGNAVALSRQLLERYGDDMASYSQSSGYLDIEKNQSAPGLAAGKPVTGTNTEPGFDPEFAVDGKLSGKYWGAKGPASLTVDLLEPQKVAAFHVFPYRGDGRYYQYTIEISVDGENWMQVVDMSTNEEPSSHLGHFHEFTAGYSFRYARLNMLSNSANPSVHVIEFKILSPEDLEALSRE